MPPALVQAIEPPPGANRVDVDHRHPQRILVDLPLGRHQRLVVGDEGDVGRRAAHVQRDRLGEPKRLADLGHSEHPCRGARETKLDRVCLRLLGADHTAARLHAEELARHVSLVEEALDVAEVATNRGPQCRTQRGGDRALELAYLGQHVARERDRALRIDLAEDLLNLTLVRGVHERPEQRHADRLDAPARVPARELGDVVGVEWHADVTVTVHPLDSFPDVLEGHDARRWLVEQPRSERAGDVHPGVFEERAVALRQDQSGRLELALEQAIRDNGRSVQHERELARRQPGGAEQGVESLAEGDRGVVRRRRNLGLGELAGFLVEQLKVGERAAYVNADPVAHRSSLAPHASSGARGGGLRSSLLGDAGNALQVLEHLGHRQHIAVLGVDVEEVGPVGLFGAVADRLERQDRAEPV